MFTEPDAHPAAVSGPSAEQEALLQALTKLFAPLAQLCVGNGLTIQTVEEALRRAYVHAGQSAHQSAAAGQAERLISRISASTGLTRREVTRLLAQQNQSRAHKPSAANEVFTRWLTDPQLQGPDGKPIKLMRQSGEASFEQLAQSVTRDVHPRTILQELLRLELVRLEDDGNQLSLNEQAFVPRSDKVRMAEFFGDNLGDHLQAATENLLRDGRQHLEQAVFADELSAHSVEQVKKALTEIWQSMLTRLTAEFTERIEEDKALGRVQDRKMRVGLYSLHQLMPAADASSAPAGEISKGESS